MRGFVGGGRESAWEMCLWMVSMWIRVQWPAPSGWCTGMSMWCRVSMGMFLCKRLCLWLLGLGRISLENR